MNRTRIIILIFLCGLLASLDATSQRPRPLPGIPSDNPNQQNSGATQIGQVRDTRKNNDSLNHRTGLEDSITITFRYLDSSRLQRFDSSIHDFYNRFPIPVNYVYIGNNGNAAHNILFSPYMQPGFDPGFHAFDVYKFNIAETRFYNTTRPYSELGYLLGSKAEQIIHLLHTQNVKPNWNIALQYRLINSPGFFQNQNTNHNSYRVNSYYQSRNKRYSNFVIFVANKLASAENGGIKVDLPYLDSSAFQNRSGVPVKLGQPDVTSNNFFSNDIPTGTRYTDAHFMVRQQYDLGQKDSLVINDTTVVPLFYPRLRFEYNFMYSKSTYRFNDANPDSGYQVYKQGYGIDTAHPFYLQDRWKEIMNDFSIYTFPDKKNPQQFLKLGATIQNLAGTFDTSKQVSSRSTNLYNFFAHGEYRNRTRNQKWDVELFGNLYIAGYNSGDYDAYISLKRLISKQLGFLQLGFRNVNRSPSFIYDMRSAFWKQKDPADFKKENIIQAFGSIEMPQRKLRLTGNYYVVTNYLYFKDLNLRDQETSVFNLVQLTLEKQFRLFRNWQWRTRMTLQQKAGSAPVNVPLFYTRNQVGYEGTLGFPNLRTAFGVEIRYYTPYKADGYSPFFGQFVYQNRARIQNTPDLSLYLNFRIKSFTSYVRLENLNTYQFAGNNTGFTNNNFAAPDYPMPGLVFRLGIFWSFVN